MLVRLFSAAVNGLDVRTVEVEVNISKGMGYSLVGLPDSAVRESYTRTQTAIANSGFHFATNSIVVNLAPADLRKEGSGYDLPIALGILAAEGAVDKECLSKYMLVGELGLDGSLRPVRGALPIAIHARAEEYEGLIVPIENVREAAAVNKLKVYGAENLAQVVDHFNGRGELTQTIVDTRKEFYDHQTSYLVDFSEVRGQENVKRAFEVAAAGGHNILLVGSPGCGKSMMAKRLPTILPPLTLSESLETTQIHSVAGILDGKTSLVTVRPFRNPHHTISDVALIGGGTNFMPGEISLAHNGVLFLTNFPNSAVPPSKLCVSPRRPHCQHHPREIQRNTSVFLYACCIDESLSLRLPQRPHAHLRVLAGANTALLEQNIRPVARPHRCAGGNTTRAVQRIVASRKRRNLCRNP